MLDFLGGLFTSIISGGMTGILGVAVQRIADYKNKELDLKLNKEKYAHEVEMKKADAAILEKEYAARVKVAALEQEGQETMADAQAFSQSFNEPIRFSPESSTTVGQTWVFVILDFLRGLIRPTLTVYLCVLTTLVYFQAKEALNGVALTSAEHLSLIQQITGTILYLTTTCVLWWFGTRNHAKGPIKGKNYNAK